VSEPFYLSGDPFSNSDYSDGIQEVECAECGQLAEVPTKEEYSHGETSWWAEWICVYPMKMWSAEEDYLCDAVGELEMVECVDILIVPEGTTSTEINFAD